MLKPDVRFQIDILITLIEIDVVLDGTYFWSGAD